jgi:hypothetical protein
MYTQPSTPAPSTGTASITLNAQSATIVIERGEHQKCCEIYYDETTQPKFDADRLLARCHCTRTDAWKPTAHGWTAHVRVAS